jgi:hypothetical protein
MRAAGVPYEERMAKLEEIEHPKPLREFLYETFNAFAAAHPWVEEENIRPKSIAREMYERYLSFADYIRDYGLERSEGLLLRHLSQVWKVLAQTVPDGAKTDEVVEMEDYFRELIRGIDSSLLEEWERCAIPDSWRPSRRQAGAAGGLRRHARHRRVPPARAHRHLGFLQDVAARDWEGAASRLLTGEPRCPAEGEPTSDEARRIEAAFAPISRRAAGSGWIRRGGRRSTRIGRRNGPRLPVSGPVCPDALIDHRERGSAPHPHFSPVPSPYQPWPEEPVIDAKP